MPGLLDVLHHRGDVGRRRRRRARRRRARSRSRGSGRRAPRRRRPPSPRATSPSVVADPHRAPAEHVRRPHEHRVADPRGDRGRLVRRSRRSPTPGSGRRPRRRAAPNRSRSSARSIASNGVPRIAEAGPLDRARELERRLAAELDADADRLLALEHREHRLLVERLEVEPVGRVVVGRDGLRVAVDHHRLVPLRAEALRGVDAAVVELDPLADPVRAAAEDHDRPARLRRRLVELAARRVEVVRGASTSPAQESTRR